MSSPLPLAGAAPREPGLSGTLILVWGFLAIYLILFFLTALTSANVVTKEVLSRGQLWAWLVLPDQIAERWFQDFDLHSLAERGLIVAVALVIFGVATAAGSLCLPLTKRLGWSVQLDALERFVVSAGVGLNLLSLLTLALGLAGLLRQHVFFAIGSAIVMIAGLLALRRHTDSVGLPRDPPSAAGEWRLSPAWLLVGLPFVLLIVLGALMPPLDFDTREYHLQAPKEFFQAGRITFLPHNVYANMPLGTEMLSLLSMVVTGDWWRGALVGKTVIGLFAPLTALALWAAGRRLATPAAGIIAALVYISTPWIVLVSTLGFVEGGFACYLLLALYAVLLWQTHRAMGERGDGLLALAGFLAGAAVGCKYPAVVFCAIPLAAWIGHVAFWHPPRVGFSHAVRAMLVFTLFGAIGCGPWLVKNAVLTGNPTYPLLYRVFDGATRTPEKEAQWSRAHSPPNHQPASFVERGADALLRSDWLSPVLMPLAALALVFASPWRRLARGLAGYVLLVFVLWWLFTHHMDRFWVPILPVTALIAGMGAVWSGSKWWRYTLAVFLTVGLVYNFLVIASGKLIDNRYFSSYETLRLDTDNVNPWHLYLNAHRDEVTGVLLVADAQPFDLEVPVIYNTVFDDSIFEQLARDRSPDEVRALLAERHISHIYVDWSEVDRYRSPGNYGITDFIQPAVFERLVADGVLEPVHVTNDHAGELYRVTQVAHLAH